MKIKLTKKTLVGKTDKPKGWEAEVQRDVALQLIKDKRAVLVESTKVDDDFKKIQQSRAESEG